MKPPLVCVATHRSSGAPVPFWGHWEAPCLPPFSWYSEHLSQPNSTGLSDVPSLAPWVSAGAVIWFFLPWRSLLMTTEEKCNSEFDKDVTEQPNSQQDVVCVQCSELLISTCRCWSTCTQQSRLQLPWRTREVDPGEARGVSPSLVLCLGSLI